MSTIEQAARAENALRAAVRTLLTLGWSEQSIHESVDDAIEEGD